MQKVHSLGCSYLLSSPPILIKLQCLSPLIMLNVVYALFLSCHKLINNIRVVHKRSKCLPLAKDRIVRIRSSLAAPMVRPRLPLSPMGKGQPCQKALQLSEYWWHFELKLFVLEHHASSRIIFACICKLSNNNALQNYYRRSISDLYFQIC